MQSEHAHEQSQQGYDSIVVANQFIDVAAGKGNPICSVTKLIKLVYIAHGYFLALRNRSLIREQVVAWPYGPVIPRIYHAFKREPPVPEPLPKSQAPITGSDKLDETAAKFVRTAHKGYGHLSFSQLSALTHKQGTPWDVVWQQQGQGAVIENDLIKEYYSGVIEDAG